MFKKILTAADLFQFYLKKRAELRNGTDSESKSLNMFTDDWFLSKKNFQSVCCVTELRADVKTQEKCFAYFDLR